MNVQIRQHVSWLFFMLFLAVFCGNGQSAGQTTTKTRVVLLGTGSPAPDPDHSGPGTAIVVNDTAYLVDLGPGVVHNPLTFRPHSWVSGPHFHPVDNRSAHSARGVWPKGLKAMTEHLQEAYRIDIETRTNADGNQREFPEGHIVNVHEISTGIIYKDANVTVSAFPTKHAMESYGYRFDTPDRTIVVSGDTNPTQATIDACSGCDVLIHEAHAPAWIATRPPTFQRFAAKYHTTTAQLADLARQAKPRLLIIYHYPNAPEDVFADMSKRYTGEFVIGRDLDIY